LEGVGGKKRGRKKKREIQKKMGKIFPTSFFLTLLTLRYGCKSFQHWDSCFLRSKKALDALDRASQGVLIDSGRRKTHEFRFRTHQQGFLDLLLEHIASASRCGSQCAVKPQRGCITDRMTSAAHQSDRTSIRYAHLIKVRMSYLPAPLRVTGAYFDEGN